MCSLRRSCTSVSKSRSIDSEATCQIFLSQHQSLTLTHTSNMVRSMCWHAHLLSRIPQLSCLQAAKPAALDVVSCSSTANIGLPRNACRVHCHLHDRHSRVPASCIGRARSFLCPAEHGVAGRVYRGSGVILSVVQILGGEDKCGMFGLGVRHCILTGMCVALGLRATGGRLGVEFSASRETCVEGVEYTCCVGCVIHIKAVDRSPKIDIKVKWYCYCIN